MGCSVVCAVTEGERGDCLYFIESGAAEVINKAGDTINAFTRTGEATTGLRPRLEIKPPSRITARAPPVRHLRAPAVELIVLPAVGWRVGRTRPAGVPHGPSVRVALGTLRTGDWFGELALLNDDVRTATIRGVAVDGGKVKW